MLPANNMRGGPHQVARLSQPSYQVFSNLYEFRGLIFNLRNHWVCFSSLILSRLILSKIGKKNFFFRIICFIDMWFLSLSLVDCFWVSLEDIFWNIWIIFFSGFTRKLRRKLKLFFENGCVDTLLLKFFLRSYICCRIYAFPSELVQIFALMEVPLVLIWRISWSL